MCSSIEILVRIRAAGITPANVAEASVTKEIGADLEQQGVHFTELHIDRGYVSSHFVRERSDELAHLLQSLACPRGEVLLAHRHVPQDSGPAEHALSSRTGDALCPRWGCACSQRNLRSVSEDQRNARRARTGAV
jgi:hypothetical protein